MRTYIFLLAAVLITSLSQAQTQAPPLVDGKCQEYEGLKAKVIELDHGVKLHFYQDQYFVFVCYCYQEGSFGDLDLQVDSPGLSEPINIHVSAQLGEWPINKPEEKPDGPLSKKWWNHDGWTANVIWPNGIDRSGERARPQYKNAGARELQISKTRFGKGEWKLKFSIRALRTDDGMANLNFPEGAKAYILQVH